MFQITQNKGFQIKFSNGWTVSVQWGAGIYYSNYDLMRYDGSAVEPSATAEIAAWDENGKWLDFEHDQVKGWCSPDEVAAFIMKISQMPG